MINSPGSYFFNTTFREEIIQKGGGGYSGGGEIIISMSYFSTPPLERELFKWGSYSGEGGVIISMSYYFNAIFSLLTEQNSNPTDAKLSILVKERDLQCTRRAPRGPGSYSTVGVIFSMSVPREGGGGELIERGSYSRKYGICGIRRIMRLTEEQVTTHDE